MRLSLFIIGLLLLGGSSGLADESTTAVNSPKVILFIGDGMDDQQISIARNYLVGSNGQLAMDTMDYRGVIRPQSVSEENPAQHVYVTGSAPAATSMATGIVTSGVRVSTFAQNDKDAVTIMELANNAGIGTGVVTTASVTDATPASFMAHVSNRDCQGPEDMVRINERNPRASYECTGDYKANEGKGSIAEQIAKGSMDIVLGGGWKYFDQLGEGESEKLVLQLARDNGFEVITSRSELLNIPRDKSILGLFAPDIMPPMLIGNGATNHDRELPEPYSCEENPEFADVPRLLEMTQAAIRHLEARGGFMLVIENETIDKQAHYLKPCGHIGGVAQIDETLKFVLQYAESHPELLVMVAADHGHAAQIIAAHKATAVPRYVAQLITADESVMAVNYATTTSNTQTAHTGAQVPLLASGMGVDEWPIFMPQTEVFHIARRHLGLEESVRADN